MYEQYLYYITFPLLGGKDFRNLNVVVNWVAPNIFFSLEKKYIDVFTNNIRHSLSK